MRIVVLDRGGGDGNTDLSAGGGGGGLTSKRLINSIVSHRYQVT